MWPIVYAFFVGLAVGWLGGALFAKWRASRKWVYRLSCGGDIGPVTTYETWSTGNGEIRFSGSFDADAGASDH